MDRGRVKERVMIRAIVDAETIPTARKWQYYLRKGTRCPSCGHLGETVSRVKLLDGPVKVKCQSVRNPCAVDCLCEWDEVITDEGRSVLIDLLSKITKHGELSGELDALGEEIEVINDGYINTEIAGDWIKEGKP